MISYQEIQTKYNELYLQLAKYFWPYTMVEAIADMESEAYKVFPDMKILKQKIEAVGKLCREEMKEDEDLDKAYKDFMRSIKEQDSTYAKLVKPIEEM